VAYEKKMKLMWLVYSWLDCELEKSLKYFIFFVAGNKDLPYICNRKKGETQRC
jgi:hypothetical protein